VESSNSDCSSNGNSYTTPASVPVFEYFERGPPYCRELLTNFLIIFDFLVLNEIAIAL